MESLVHKLNRLSTGSKWLTNENGIIPVPKSYRHVYQSIVIASSYNDNNYSRNLEVACRRTPNELKSAHLFAPLRSQLLPFVEDDTNYLKALTDFAPFGQDDFMQIPMLDCFAHIPMIPGQNVQLLGSVNLQVLEAGYSLFEGHIHIVHGNDADSIHIGRCSTSDPVLPLYERDEHMLSESLIKVHGSLDLPTALTAAGANNAEVIRVMVMAEQVYQLYEWDGEEFPVRNQQKEMYPLLINIFPIAVQVNRVVSPPVTRTPRRFNPTPKRRYN